MIKMNNYQFKYNKFISIVLIVANIKPYQIINHNSNKIIIKIQMKKNIIINNMKLLIK
jgi:hypothetical protein